MYSNWHWPQIENHDHEESYLEIFMYMKQHQFHLSDKAHGPSCFLSRGLSERTISILRFTVLLFTWFKDIKQLHCSFNQSSAYILIWFYSVKSTLCPLKRWYVIFKRLKLFSKEIGTYQGWSQSIYIYNHHIYISFLAVTMGTLIIP